MLPSNLLHPLKLDVVGFKEDDQAYRDVPIHNKRVTIWMVRRRYKCNDCGSTFRPELKDMDDRRMMTKRLTTACQYQP